jgi:hypothetical protein
MSPEPCQAPGQHEDTWAQRATSTITSRLADQAPWGPRVCTGRPQQVVTCDVVWLRRMAAAPAVISEGLPSPNSAAIALCSSVACLPHRLDGLPGVGGRYRFGTPSSACRDAWGRLHHARMGRSQLFAIALLYSVWTTESEYGMDGRLGLGKGVASSHV